MPICLQLEKFYPDIYHIEDNTQYLKFVLQDRMFEVIVKRYLHKEYNDNHDKMMHNSLCLNCLSCI